MHQAFYGLMLCRHCFGIRQVPDMASTKSGKTNPVRTLVFVRLGVPWLFGVVACERPGMAWALPRHGLGAASA